MKLIIISILLCYSFAFGADYTALADTEAEKHITKTNTQIQSILDKAVGESTEVAIQISAGFLGKDLYKLSDYEKQIVKMDHDNGHMIIYTHKIQCCGGAFFCIHVSKDTKSRNKLIVTN